jgi:hypothetical protein
MKVGAAAAGHPPRDQIRGRQSPTGQSSRSWHGVGEPPGWRARLTSTSKGAAMQAGQSSRSCASKKARTRATSAACAAVAAATCARDRCAACMRLLTQG